MSKLKINNIPKNRLLALAAEMEYEKCRDKDIKRMLKDNLYFEKYWEQDRIGKLTGVAPIVRRKTYKDISDNQFPQGYFLKANPNAPVVMKGSIFCLNRKHSKCGFGYVYDIVERYLKLIGYSCIDKKKHIDKMIKIGTRLSHKGYKTGRNFEYYHIPEDNYGFWFMGDWINNEDERYMQILEKTNQAKAAQINREIDKKKKDKLYQEALIASKKKKVQESEEQRKRHEKLLELNRKRRAEQIAAHELLMEMKNA